MARVIYAVGRLADKPYRIEKIERNVYSAEELCYSLVQSAQILDAGIMDPSLVSWLREECGLPELADRLAPYLGKERALSDFVSEILTYVGFVPQEKEETTRQIVSSGQGMEPFEKRMANASYLAEGARPYEALEEYDAILASLPSPERRMRARILCEEGRIYAQLFRFRAAASCYEKAYQLTGSSEIYLNYLAATRLGLSDSEYISFVSEHPESVNASLELEKRMDSLIAGFNASERKLAIDSLKRYQSEGQDASYEVALHQTLQKLKEEYRSSLAAPVA